MPVTSTLPLRRRMDRVEIKTGRSLDKRADLRVPPDYVRIFSANRSRAAWRETPSAIPISPHDRPLACARATSSRTRASLARTLSTASASVRRSIVLSIVMPDGSNPSASQRGGVYTSGGHTLVERLECGGR